MFRTWLRSANPALFSVYAILAAFSTYTCMYAFRKAFTVATFDGMVYAGVDYKIWLIAAQVIGYTLSKFIGIKVVAEMGPQGRARSILALIGIAGAALLGFALVPPPYNIPFLFLNGLPLGMVWGLVFSYLEGRRFTEVLGAGLSASFIFSSGFVKSIGSYTMQAWGTSPFWMPIVTGLLFSLPLLFFVWMLGQLPPPSAEDEKLRTKREPMNAEERWRFMRTFATGLVLLIVVYAMLTAYRDFRDNFAAEIWQALGYGDSPAIFTLTEIPVAVAVLVIMGLVMFIKDNLRALMVNHLFILIGVIMVGGGTAAFQAGVLSAPVWMILIGFGLYMGYVPFNSIFFDRLIAAFKYVSNVGFMIYLADAFGYLGSVGVLFYKDFGQPDLSWLSFFIASSYVLASVGTVLTLASMAYFWRKHRTWSATQQPIAASVPA